MRKLCSFACRLRIINLTLLTNEYSVASHNYTFCPLTLRSSFFDRIQLLKNSKYESELIKIVDCLLDDHGIIDNPMLYFEDRK